MSRDVYGMDAYNGQIKDSDRKYGDGRGPPLFGNISKPPRFADAEYHLSTQSELIDTATETPPVILNTDFEGDARTIDYDGVDTAKDNDMGADEVTGGS